MRSIKLIAFALVLGLTGAIHAAGLTQDATQTDATAKPGCCKMHMAGDKKSAADETCNMKDGDCCKADCCKAHAAKSQANAHAKSQAGTHADCCASSDCCKDCASCKAHHAATSEANADKGARQGCCASCCKSHQAAH